MSFNLNSSTYSLKAPSRTKSRSRDTTLSNYSSSQNQSPSSSSNFRRVNKAQSHTFKKTHETDEFEEASSDFVVLNDSVDPTANFNSGLEINYHEDGCPLAVKALVKVIKSNQLAIQMSGGAYFAKYGTCFVSSNVNPNFANMTLSPNSSISSARAKKRYLCLTEGKLRVATILPHINLNSLYESEQKYMEGDELDSDSVSFQQTYYIQRLRTIRFVSLNSNTVVLVFLVPKRSKAKTAFGETLVKNTLKRMKKFDSSANMLGLSTKRKQKAQQQQQQQTSQNLNKFYQTAVDSDNLSTNSLLSRNSTRSLNSTKNQQQQQQQQQQPEVNGNTLFRFRLHSTNSTTLGRTLSKTSSMLFRSKNKNKNKKRQTKKGKKAAAKQKLQHVESETESVTLPEMENLTPTQVQSSPKKKNDKNKEMMKHQTPLTQLQKSQSLNNLQLTKAQRNKLQLRNLPPRVGTQVSTVSSQNLSVNNTSFNSVTSNFTDSEQETEQSDFEQESEQKNNNNSNHRDHEDKDKENKITINVNVSGLDVEVQTTKKTQDELLISEEIEEESIELKFESAELCQDWVKHLLVEVENQAKMFTAYADILEKDLKDNSNKKTKRSSDRMTKSSEINLEVFLRYAVDLLTLCKGIRNKSVWQARERLAVFLEQDSRTKVQQEEARLWFELSFQLRNNPNNNNTSDSPKVEVRDTKLSTKSSGSVTSFKSMFTKFSDEPTLTRAIYKQHSQLNAHQKPRTRDEAYKKLVLFLEQFAFGRKVGSIENLAKSMFERYELPELSKRLEHEFGRVPEGFENYLAETEESALECLQREAAELAKGIRKGGNNGRKHNMKQY